MVGAGQRKIVDEEPPIGNGRAMSVLFAREGAQVACIDVNKEAADNTVAQIAGEGGKAFTDVVDVSDVAAIAPAVERCAQKLGGLDGLALNVGISCGLSLPKMTAEAWDSDYAVNVRSHMLFAQKALTMMAPGGAIVLTSSMASQRANGRNPAYESSKAAQIALGRAIARAGEENGIRCNVIAPGFIDSPMGRDASRRRPDRAHHGAFRPPGHRLGGRLCCAVSDLERIFLRQRAHAVPRRRPHGRYRAGLECAGRMARGIAPAAAMPNSCLHPSTFRKVPT